MRSLKNICEVAVIGGGLAGLSAARHAVRLGRLVTLFEASGLFGGLVATIGEVDGLPVPGKFSGQELAIHLLQDARKAAAQVVQTGVARIELDKRLTLTDQENKTYHPEAIIIASGASPRKLGVPGEEEFVGRGVSRCATCDGGFFRNQDVVVVGGGDGAVQEALVLAKTSRRVIMVCRSVLQGEARLYREARRAREREFRVGQRGQRDSRRRRGQRRSAAQCEGRHELGHRMRGSLSVHWRDAEHRIRSCIVAVLQTGHIKTTPRFATSDSRVFAVGAARADYGGNLVEAMAEGVGAAEAVARLLLH